MPYRKFLAIRFGAILVVLGALFLLFEREYQLLAVLGVLAGAALLLAAHRLRE